MLPLDAHSAARVCQIAADLIAHESQILVTSPLRRHSRVANTRGTKLGSAWASFLQAPAQALTHTLFGTTGAVVAKGHLHPLDTGLLDDDKDSRDKGMIWLAWDDCRCLFQVFRALEYVDALGKPTALVDTFASRMTAGEAVPSASASPTPIGGGGGRRQSFGAPGNNGIAAASRLWGWGGSAPAGTEGCGTGDTYTEEHVRTAAWKLVSSIFARATALKISAEAEEVSESDAQAVLTWFPQLTYLEVQSIPRASLRFWDSWVPGRISGLKIRYAGLDLTRFLDIESDEKGWSRLVLLDLSGNPGIDQSPLKGRLSQQLANVARISLAQCELEKVPASLTSLYNLSWLDLNDNAIGDISHISLQLGSIVRLNLARNHLSDLTGLCRMWALEYLDVSENMLDSWLPVLVLRNLPSLSVLNVRGNPFALNDPEEHHRPQIFSAFDHRDIALVLDGHGPTSQERREMAKIPRVATGHAAGGASKATEAPAMKMRRPKVAVIEESVGDEDGSELAAKGRVDVADLPSSPSPRCGHGPGLSASPIHSHLGSLEKTPRVLRATELQAVTVASAHRRSNMAHFETQSPTAHSISVRPRSRFKRRATASTLNGTRATATNVPNLQPAHTYSVPSSFSVRPTSPAPSSVAPSVRMGGAAMRDPERYRRRVEMMRAEAGSSWLRAFAELQSQSPTASPDSHALYQNDAHFEQISSRRLGSPLEPSQ
ncbi:hypothetical protein GGI20_001276, partial [Coemansia sp. BCRC 34301]